MAIRQFLLKAKPTAIVLALKDTAQVWYPSRLAQVSGASYVYVTHWLTKLEKAGWVKIEKKGRLKAVVLTEGGQIAALALDELVRKIEGARAPPEPAGTTSSELGAGRAGIPGTTGSAKKEEGAKEKAAAPKATESKN